jgi:hypothetical protein
MLDTRPLLLVVERHARRRSHLVGQLVADEFDAEGAGSPGETRCRFQDPLNLPLLGEFEAPNAALALLREIRSSEALRSPLDPQLSVIVLSGAKGEWVPRASEGGLRRLRRVRSRRSGRRVPLADDHGARGTWRLDATNWPACRSGYRHEGGSGDDGGRRDAFGRVGLHPTRRPSRGPIRGLGLRTCETRARTVGTRGGARVPSLAYVARRPVVREG